MLPCRAFVFGVLFFSEPLSLLGVAGAAIIAAGVLAVSLDKQSAAAAPATGPASGTRGTGQAASLGGGQERAVQLKAKSSFKMEPDDEEGSEDPEGQNTAPGAAAEEYAQVQMAPLGMGHRPHEAGR